MPETPEHLYERAVGALRTPSYAKSATFPFEGEMHPRALQPPLPETPRRPGEGGVDCRTCGALDDQYVWTDARWRLRALNPSGVPLIMMLEPREHYAEPGDLPDDLAAEQGLMLSRVDRAMSSIGDVGRVHVYRWGDGGAHLHWWLLARPARMLQTFGTYAMIWDDILPVTPDDIWQANVDHVVQHLATTR